MNRLFFTSDVDKCLEVDRLLLCRNLSAHLLFAFSFSESQKTSFNVFPFSAYLHDDARLTKSSPMTDICVSISRAEL